jgi:hypothetical protein
MLDQLVDGVRKASESTLNAQQELLRQWSRMWLRAAPATPAGAEAAGDRKRAARWLDVGLETLRRHRESLDATYRSSLQVLERTLKSAGRL